MMESLKVSEMSDLTEVKAGITEAGSAVQAARTLLNQGSLIDDLNGLAEIITAERDAVAGEMKTLSDSKRAASAYGSGADSSSKSPRK